MTTRASHAAGDAVASTSDAGVDVILATHERPHTLGYAIDAVLRQTHRRLHLHVVGDGCVPGTEEVVRSFVDPRVHFYSFPKAMGYGYVHRNHVLQRTTAPFIAYMTDDDLWFPDHLENGVRLLQEHTLDLVAFRSYHVQFPNELDPYFFAFDWRSRFATQFLRNWFTGSVTCVHRRSVFDRVGYWNDQLFRFGDREFYNRVRVSTVPSQWVDQVTVLRFYAQHWNHRYRDLKEPPQKTWAPLVQDPAWRERLRRQAAPGRRSLATRAHQWADFVRFAFYSGPKFLRFWHQRPVRAAVGEQ